MNIFFTSGSRNKPSILLEDVEKEEIYDYRIKSLNSKKSNQDNIEMIQKLLTEKANYNSFNKGIHIQNHITHTAAEDIIKNGLKAIKATNKFGTQDIYELFDDYFVDTGIKLINQKYDFSIPEITRTLIDYIRPQQLNDRQQFIFNTICRNINLGLDAIINTGIYTISFF